MWLVLLLLLPLAAVIAGVVAALLLVGFDVDVALHVLLYLSGALLVAPRRALKVRRLLDCTELLVAS